MSCWVDPMISRIWPSTILRMMFFLESIWKSERNSFVNSVLEFVPTFLHHQCYDMTQAQRHNIHASVLISFKQDQGICWLSSPNVSCLRQCSMSPFLGKVFWKVHCIIIFHNIRRYQTSAMIIPAVDQTSVLVWIRSLVDMDLEIWVIFWTRVLVQWQNDSHALFHVFKGEEFWEGWSSVKHSLFKSASMNVLVHGSILESHGNFMYLFTGL